MVPPRQQEKRAMKVQKLSKKVLRTILYPSRRPSGHAYSFELQYNIHIQWTYLIASFDPKSNATRINGVIVIKKGST